MAVYSVLMAIAVLEEPAQVISIRSRQDPNPYAGLGAADVVPQPDRTSFLSPTS